MANTAQAVREGLCLFRQRKVAPVHSSLNQYKDLNAKNPEIQKNQTINLILTCS
jgi:hypothetical protein